MIKNVTVTYEVQVEINETKYTPEILKLYKENFQDIDTIEEHIEYIAKISTLDKLNNSYYIDPETFGVKAKIIDVNSEIKY